VSDRAPPRPGPEADGAGEPDAPAPGRRVGLIVSAIVAVVLVGFVVVLATGEPATERRGSSDHIGEIAPALSGETLDGGRYDIDNHTGEWVVVNFFATWCVPCVEEHPELVRFGEAHAASGDASVVSVVFDPDDLGDTRAFFDQQGGDWPVVVDGRDAVLDYGVVKVPETYLVAPSGIVVQKYTGGVTQATIDGDIEAATAAASASEEAA
jgi:cytochrome c biogenesis protein CcmG/thiol:disulfide interchange protein DsbE